MYILLAYLLTVLIFFGWTLKDIRKPEIRLVLSILMLSLAWPIVLIVYYLDGKEPD